MKIIIRRLVLALTIILIVIVSGCRNDQYLELKVANCDTTWYQTEIRPIIVNNCSISGCHDGTNTTPDFNIYLNLKEVIDTKINGQPEILYRLGLPTSNPDHMPNNGLMLTSIDRTKIDVWINAGYQGCDQ